MKKIVVISDLQVPYHDAKAIKNVAAFIRKFKPDEVVTIGDEIDFPTISRWTQGTPGEYAGSIGDDRDQTVQILYDLQVTQMIRSNHTDRLYNSIMKRLPGLLGAPELEFENFMRLPELGIKYHRKPYEIAPGWIAVHGDHGAINSQPGLTALGHARRHGLSVVCGHTHRAGISAFTEASGGRLNRTLWGFEVGNLMDFRQAAYTHGTANWQQAFGIIYVDRKKVTPIMVPIERDGSFIVEGKVYG